MRLLLSLLLAAVLPQMAAAAEFKYEALAYSADHYVPRLGLSGVIQADDTQALAKLYGEVVRCGDACMPPEGGATAVLTLDSPGGNYREGLALAQFARDHRIATVVEKGKSCYSACAFAFLGGTAFSSQDGIGAYIDRTVEPGATLGFHAPYFPDDKLQDLIAQVGLGEVLGGSRDDIALMVQSLVDWNVDPLVIAYMVSMGPDQTYDLTRPDDLFLVRAALPALPPSTWQADPKEALRNACVRLLANRQAQEPVEVDALAGLDLIDSVGTDSGGSTIAGFRLGPDNPLDVTFCGAPAEQLTGYDLDVGLYTAPGIDGHVSAMLMMFNRVSGWSTLGTGGKPTRRIFQKGSLSSFLMPADMDLSTVSAGVPLAVLFNRFFAIHPPALPSIEGGEIVADDGRSQRTIAAGRLVVRMQAGNDALFSAGMAQLPADGIDGMQSDGDEMHFVRSGSYSATGEPVTWIGQRTESGALLMRIDAPGMTSLTAEESRLVANLACTYGGVCRD